MVKYFKKVSLKIFKDFADIKQLQLQSGLSSNITGLRLIEIEAIYKSDFMLGETLIASEEVNEACEEFLCHLYGAKHLSGYDLHYHFCVSGYDLHYHFCVLNGDRITFTSSKQYSGLTYCRSLVSVGTLLH